MNNIHDVSLVSSEEGVNIIILSDSLEQLGCIFLSFFQINELLQEVTQFQEEQSKALLWQVHPSDSREKAHLIIHKWFFDIEDLQRPPPG